MKIRAIAASILSPALITFSLNCASSRTYDPVQTEGGDYGEVDFVYFQNKERYRISINSTEAIVHYALYRRSELLNEGLLDRQDYRQWLSQVRSYTSRHGLSKARSPQSPEYLDLPCVDLFRIRLNLEFHNQTFEGCGSAEEGGEMYELAKRAKKLKHETR